MYSEFISETAFYYITYKNHIWAVDISSLYILSSFFTWNSTHLAVSDLHKTTYWWSLFSMLMHVSFDIKALAGRCLHYSAAILLVFIFVFIFISVCYTVMPVPNYLNPVSCYFSSLSFGVLDRRVVNKERQLPGGEQIILFFVNFLSFQYWNSETAIHQVYTTRHCLDWVCFLYI